MQTEVELCGPDEALLQWVSDGVREVLIQTGSVEAHMVIERPGKSGRQMMLMDPEVMRSDEAKEVFCHAFRQAAQEFEVERYAFVCEGWVANATPDDPQSQRRPSEREDRREVLIIAVSNRQGEAIASMREILRDSAGQVSGLGPEEHTPELKLGGRFIGLLSAEE
jgi:hypothetical protein